MKWTPICDDDAREMYSTGRANRTAKVLSRLWGVVFALGLMPPRWVRLEVPGRSTGETRSFPLGMADVDGSWYLVSMLGECSWVRNVRAADGRAVLRRRRATPCVLHEVPPEQRAPILRRYVDKVPGGRPHIPVEQGSAVEEFAAIAAEHPVFRVEKI